MNEITDHDIIQAMKIYGGSFVATLAELYQRADRDNAARIKNTWPEYWEQYREMARRQMEREQ